MLEDIADTNLIQFEDQKSNLNDTMVSEAKENDNEEEELLVVTEQKLASQAKGHEQDYFASSAENDGMGDLGHTNAILGLDEEEGGDDQKKIKNMDFFKTKSLLPLMIINEKTQLGGLVSLSKRF